MRLSKTNYLSYRNCPKNAWLKIHKPDIYHRYPLSSFELNIIETGNEIDLLARELFPGGVTVENREDDKLTQLLMQDKVPVIYQPVFITDKYITACDIFVWNDESGMYDLYEVKSSTASSETEGGKRKTTEYVIDIAFQKAVLSDLGITVDNTYLVRLDKEYARRGELDLQELFLIEDWTENVDEILPEIKNQMETAYEYLSRESEPTGYCDCITKGRKGFCTTAYYSIPNLPEYPIHDILRLGNSKRKFQELVDSNILDIHGIEPDFFKNDSNYALQVQVAQSGKEYVDHVGIQEFLDDIQYPISFLDYETYPSALPRFEGYRPYQQIPFQFSLHIQESPEGDLAHFDFLHLDQSSPDQDFVSALKKNIPETGSIIVWNKTFECKIINERLMQRHPEYIEFLKDLNDRVVDLMLPFSGNRKAGKSILYQHPNQRGSYSIKAVLPIFVPDVSYQDLEIQEGGTASDTWNRIVSSEFAIEEVASKAQALRDYCELDTLAMVRILKN